jgi:Protein of unknown function (DUF1156)
VIPRNCKRLAEVDFPIAVVSKHAAREKSIRHGHPSSLHLWWARRPLAACRAILLALLLPDPCDENCPEDFKQKAHEYLVAPIASGIVGPSDLELREALLKFIGDFANWNLSSNRTFTRESAPGLTREYRLIDLRRIAEHDEAYVAHVFLRDALHVRRCDGAQLFQKQERVAPAASD